jgi:hypothetical protein
VSHTLSAESAIQIIATVESRFQRWRQIPCNQPGALPQASDDDAPLALNNQTNLGRCPWVSVRQNYFALKARHQTSLGQRPRISVAPNYLALKARHQTSLGQRPRIPATCNYPSAESAIQLVAR